MDSSDEMRRQQSAGSFSPHQIVFLSLNSFSALESYEVDMCVHASAVHEQHEEKVCLCCSVNF